VAVVTASPALTGPAHRRRLTGWLDQARRDGADTGGPVAVAMIDIDHSQAYNDHYGHPGRRRLSAVRRRRADRRDADAGLYEAKRHGRNRVMSHLPA
jgi:PleD family two-component response regulator